MLHFRHIRSILARTSVPDNHIDTITLFICHLKFNHLDKITDWVERFQFGRFNFMDDVRSKIEEVPRGIQSEKSSEDTASSRNMVSTIWAQASPKKGDGTRCKKFFQTRKIVSITMESDKRYVSLHRVHYKACLEPIIFWEFLVWIWNPQISWNIESKYPCVGYIYKTYRDLIPAE